MGIYVGAGGVKTVNSLYVGAGGVKTVTAVYVGAGGTYKVWPDLYTTDLTTGNEWGWYAYYSSSYGTFTNGTGIHIRNYTIHEDEGTSSAVEDRDYNEIATNMRTTNYAVNANTLSGYNTVTVTYTCTSYYSYPLKFDFYCDGSGSLSSGNYSVVESTSSSNGSGLALANGTNLTTSSTLTSNFKSAGSSLVYFYVNHMRVTYPTNYDESIYSLEMYISKIEFS